MLSAIPEKSIFGPKNIQCRKTVRALQCELWKCIIEKTTPNKFIHKFGKLRKCTEALNDDDLTQKIAKATKPKATLKETSIVMRENIQRLCLE